MYSRIDTRKGGDRMKLTRWERYFCLMAAGQPVLLGLAAAACLVRWPLWELFFTVGVIGSSILVTVQLVTLFPVAVLPAGTVPRLALLLVELAVLALFSWINGAVYAGMDQFLAGTALPLDKLNASDVEPLVSSACLLAMWLADRALCRRWPPVCPKQQ